MSSARRNLSSEAWFEQYELDNPFAEGTFRHVAKGYYTNGPRCNQPCVAKWFKTHGLTFQDTFFDKDLQAVGKAQDLIDAFNALQLIGSTIHLNIPEVWTFKPSSRYAGRKKLLEPFINNYTKFNSNSGWSCTDDGWCEVMQALSHFSYHKSGGQIVLCDLQGGILPRRGAVLTDPVIMSRTHAYGVTDLGPEGISTFFARHRCSRYCQGHWQMPRNATVHYKLSSGTTMELPNQRPAYAACSIGSYAPIYEDDSDDYYDSDDY